MAELLGAVSACMSIATTLIDSTLRVKALCESYQSAQGSLNLISTRVTTITAALSQIEEWSNTAPATQSNEEAKAALKEVVESITTVLSGISESLRSVEEAWKPGLRYLWDESKLSGFGRDLSDQIGDLHFLFSAVNWYVTTFARYALWYIVNTSVGPEARMPRMSFLSSLLRLSLENLFVELQPLLPATPARGGILSVKLALETGVGTMQLLRTCQHHPLHPGLIDLVRYSTMSRVLPPHLLLPPQPWIWHEGPVCCYPL
jgi:hypothetical protein